MAQLFQEKQEMSKEGAQELTLKIEEKVRTSCSESEYKDNILTILKLIKHSLLNTSDFLNTSNPNLQELKEKVKAFEKQNGEGIENGLAEGDSPQLHRDSKSETIPNENGPEQSNIEVTN